MIKYNKTTKKSTIEKGKGSYVSRIPFSNLPVHFYVSHKILSYEKSGEEQDWDEKYRNFAKIVPELPEDNKQMLNSKVSNLILSFVDKVNASFAAEAAEAEAVDTVEAAEKAKIPKIILDKPKNNQRGNYNKFMKRIICHVNILLNLCLAEFLIDRKNELLRKDELSNKEKKELERLKKTLSYPFRTNVNERNNIIAKILNQGTNETFPDVIETYKELEIIEKNKPVYKSRKWGDPDGGVSALTSSRIKVNRTNLHNLLIKGGFLKEAKGIPFHERMTEDFKKLIHNCYVYGSSSKNEYKIKDEDGKIEDKSICEVELPKEASKVLPDVKKLNEFIEKGRNRIKINGLHFHPKALPTNTLNFKKDLSGEYNIGRIYNMFCGLTKSYRLDRITIDDKNTYEKDARALFTTFFLKMVSEEGFQYFDIDNNKHTLTFSKNLKNLIKEYDSDIYNLTVDIWNKKIEEATKDWHKINEEKGYPFDEDELAEEIRKLKTNRSNIKLAYNKLFFCEDQHLTNSLSDIGIDRVFFKKTLDYICPNLWEAIRCYEWKHLFGEESKLMLSICLKLMEENIYSIPVYDCVYVAESNSDKADEIFEETYKSFIPQCPKRKRQRSKKLHKKYESTEITKIEFPVKKEKKTNEEIEKNFKMLYKKISEDINEFLNDKDLDAAYEKVESLKGLVNSLRTFIHNNLEKESELGEQSEFKEENINESNEPDESIDNQSNEVFEMLNEYKAEKVFKTLGIDIDNIKSRI